MQGLARRSHSDNLYSGKLAAPSLPAVHPFPKEPHEGAPGEEEDVVYPFGNGSNVGLAL